jgi:hypothetical protein
MTPDCNMLSPDMLSNMKNRKFIKEENLNVDFLIRLLRKLQMDLKQE